MKKRLLALALCLVMMTSLLPLTAAAEEYSVKSVNIVADGVKIKDGYYQVNVANWKIDVVSDSEKSAFNIYSSPLCTNETFSTSSYLTDPPMENTDYYVNFGIVSSDIRDLFNRGSNFSATLTVPGYEIKTYRDPDFHGNRFLVYFKLTKTEHTWQYTVSESGSKLTAECLSCDIAPVTVKLNAHSVTLPDSPFNATVETSENFKEEFTYSDIEYKYNDSGVWKVVDPKTFTPKPGEYQAKVYINSLSGNGGAVARAASNDSPNYVYVKYTAVDPAVTAQTGDNRPIELMVGSVVVFSALAAAAFVLDSKRKNASL